MKAGCWWRVWTTLVVTASVGVLGAQQAPQVRLPDRSRSIRGFKNVALSTARGFGKRSLSLGSLLGSRLVLLPPPDQSTDLPPALEQQDLQEVYGLQSTPASPPDRMPADWFADEMSKNGLLARLVVDKFVDKDHDGVLSPGELLRPLFHQKQLQQNQQQQPPPSSVYYY